MSERNMPKDHISKDKRTAGNRQRVDISKDRATQASGTERAGKSGEAGRAGKTGKSGESGRSGKAGKPGEAGRAGKTGKPGESGRAGKTGKPAEAGRFGKSVNLGKSGRAGGKREGLSAGKSAGKHGQRIWIWVWMLLCGIFLLRIWDLNHTVETMKDKINQLTRFAAQQQERLQSLTETLEEERDLQSRGDTRGQGAGFTGDGTDGQAGDRLEGEASEAAAVSGQGVAHKVYLTFDDGPSEKTEEILEILDRYDVKATFFVVGKEGDQARETMRRIVEAGHTLGMHSYTHKYDEIYASVENFAADFEKQQDYLYEVTGVKSMIYRFPGGSSNTVSKIDMRRFAEYLDSQGVRFFDWNISSGDGGSFLVPVETLIENCTETIGNHDTSVVLMHDVPGKTTTREALPEIIEKIQAMEDTVLLPITEDTALIQHIEWQDEESKKERMW